MILHCCIIVVALFEMPSFSYSIPRLISAGLTSHTAHEDRQRPANSISSFPLPRTSSIVQRTRVTDTVEKRHIA